MTAEDDAWANFIAGINRVALEAERSPRLADPELERPDSAEDRRMRARHDKRREEFYEAYRHPWKLTALEKRRIARIRADNAQREKQAAQYRAARKAYLERRSA